MSTQEKAPSSHQQHHHYAWWLIMCLCGVDYFSTLGYQPSIAFEGAGYGEVVGLATVLVVAYIGLTAVIITAGVWYLLSHPTLLPHWISEISSGHYHLEHAPLSGKGPWVALAIACLIFPKLALGMSGFETGVLHIHLVQGTKADPADVAGRIRNTRMLLVTAALLMSVMLLGSSLVTGTDTLIPADELRLEPVKGKAMDRALAYIAHGESPHPICPLFGRSFGTIYDVSTILILWFAGASAMAGLLNMVPRYLPRYGMAPEWAAAYRPLVIAFTVINLIVTWCFRADVSAQGGAYATGVLVLMTSAAIGSLVDLSRKSFPFSPLLRLRRRLTLVGFAIITAVFIYTTIANVYSRPDGIIIASIFIACVITMSIASRIWRSRELRLKEFRFEDEAARMLWTDICADGGFRVLVPHRPGHRTLDEKEAEVRRKHRIPANVPLVFLEVHYGDPSEFQNAPIISARQEGGRFIIVARDVASVSHTIAQIAMEMGRDGTPLDIVFGWSLGNALWLAVGFVLFGQGDVPNNVVALLQKAVPDAARRPTVLVG